MSNESTAEAPGTYVVAKFGGTSVASPERWGTIEAVARRFVDEGHHAVIVCSAVAGVSDKLEQLAAAFEDADACSDILEGLRRTHRELAGALDVDAGLVTESLHEIERIADAARTLGYLDPRTRARLLSAGELMSTRLGAAKLTAQGVDVRWVDARELLDADAEWLTEDRRWLSAACGVETDEALRASLHNESGVTLTQGFLARDPETGDTVVLGRGGSDTSAAYLAARLCAERLEIWTDVDGLYSAHPGVVPSARRLEEVDYAEAETLAALGASVLHPRCLHPARAAGVPVHVRHTGKPEIGGTVIRALPAEPVLRGVAHRAGLTLVRMMRRGEWQEVGVLADITDCFRRHHLSIDLLASAPNTIQATIDPAASPLAEERFDDFLADLKQLCAVRVVPDVGTVSVVGNHLQTTTEKLAPVMRAITPFEVGLVVPGADGRHVTFVVTGEQTEDMVRKIHEAIFPVAEGPKAAPA